MDSYGVLERRKNLSVQDSILEELEILGYAVLPGILSAQEALKLRELAMSLVDAIPMGSADIIRAPCVKDQLFLDLASHSLILSVVRMLIPGRVILNQQNLVRNPGGRDTYSQARFHRDLPYQHFTSSRPLAINVLVTLDEFTVDNGATRVVPGSHKVEYFPSVEFVERHSVAICAPPGSFIFMNCMTYHAGGHNTTPRARWGLNSVYASPMIVQQVDFKQEADSALWATLTESQRDLLTWSRPH